MSIRNTSTKNADGFQYTTHVHQAFNRQPASEQTSKAILNAINNIDISGSSIDIETLAKEETLILVKERLNEELLVNTVDVSGLALEETQADLLALAEIQDETGVIINPDHPPLTKYDFTSNSLQMTALGPTTPDSRWSIDVSNNRPGWYFQNSDSGGSNCYWYSNGAGLGNQQVLLYQDFTSFYAVVTIDRTDSVNDAPFIGCYSPPTGTNDVIPTFAHSRWTFSLPGGTALYSSEQVLIYYGENPKVHSDIRHLPLQLVTSGSNGDRAPTEMIYLITTNTASGRPVGNIKYLLQNAGFSAAGVIREYEFNNSLERKQLANLSATNIPVTVSNFPLAPTSIMVSNFPATQDVSGSVSVSNFPATQDVSNTNLNSLSFTTDKGINYLNTKSTFGFPSMNDTLKASLWDGSSGFAISSTNPLPVKIMGTPATTFAWTLADFTPNDGSVGAVSPSIQADLYNTLTCFGNHTGTGGTHRLTYEFSLDNITYYDTSFVITLSNATPFNDINNLGIPYVRFKLTSNPFTSLVLNVAVK